MGLYDEIMVPPVILDDIPDSWHEEEYVVFQSKNLQQPAMQTFKIEGDKLFQKNVEREKVGTREIDMGGETIEMPEYETVDVWWTNCEYHGSFEFHTSWPPEASYGDDAYNWYSYEAWFNRGELQEILKNPDR